METQINTTDNVAMANALEQAGLRLNGKINLAEYLQKQDCYSSLIPHVNDIVITVETESNGIRVNLLKSISGSEHMLVYRLQRHIEQRLQEITQLPIIKDPTIGIAPDDFFRLNLAAAILKEGTPAGLGRKIGVSRDTIRSWRDHGLENNPENYPDGLLVLAQYLGYESAEDLFKKPQIEPLKKEGSKPRGNPWPRLFGIRNKEEIDVKLLRKAVDEGKTEHTGKLSEKDIEIVRSFLDTPFLDMLTHAGVRDDHPEDIEELLIQLPEKLTAFDICEDTQWYLAHTTTSEKEIIKRLDAGWNPSLAVVGAPGFDMELASEIPPEWLVRERPDQIQQWLFKKANITSEGAKNSVLTPLGTFIKDVQALTNDLRLYIDMTGKVDQYESLASAKIIFSSVKQYFQPLIERLEKAIDQINTK